MKSKVWFVLASILVVFGFFMLFGTAGTIDLLPSEQLPTTQMIAQIVIAVMALGVGGRVLNGYYEGEQK